MGSSIIVLVRGWHNLAKGGLPMAGDAVRKAKYSSGLPNRRGTIELGELVTMYINED